MPLAGTHVHFPCPSNMEDMLQTFRSYYKKPAVRSRILEFLGGASPESTTCDYITADSSTQAMRRPELPNALYSKLDNGLDICRSLGDRESLIAHLDVEYVNFDFVAEAYLDPVRTFELQEPVAKAIERILAHYGIRALHVLSGRGHHFAWKINRTSDVFANLCSIGRKAPSANAPKQTLRDGADSPLLHQAFAGLGMLMEFISRLVLEMATPECAIPIKLTAVEVDPSAKGRGREMISLDISEYGDPLPTRTVRAPFSAYFKPWQQLHAIGQNNIGKIGPIIFIPLEKMDTQQGLLAMHDPNLAARLAETISTSIPDHTVGMWRLLQHYMNSPLHHFHEYFYSKDHEPVARWPLTYDITHLEELPGAVRNALLFPNDLLLKPCNMRKVTEALLAKGWHPRHIAGLIRSKFERDYGWGDQWIDYSPSLRADFYVRIFAGLNVSLKETLAEVCRAEDSNSSAQWMRSETTRKNQHLTMETIRL